ncbi:hypothetical protein GW17_00028105 [Ensete ventricosum]|nr:hypothetical protein GW17_00028105 [Ensete ventricosum]
MQRGIRRLQVINGLLGGLVRSKHATINLRRGRLVGKQGRVEPVIGTHARGRRTLRGAGCGLVRGGLTQQRRRKRLCARGR